MRRQIDHRRRIVLPAAVDDWGTREVEVVVAPKFVLIHPPEVEREELLRVLRANLEVA
jgi:hypothetical protein